MNEYPALTITLHWSEEQNVYIGQVQELVVVEGSGDTYEEALASTLEAMRWWKEMTTRQATPLLAQPEHDVTC